MRPLVLSIRSTVLLAIVAGMVLPAIVLLAVERQLARDSHQPVVDRTRASVLVLGASMLTEPAWTLSEAGLHAAAERIAQEPSVCGAEVLDLQPAATPMQVQARRCADDHRVAVREVPVVHEGQTIARLRVQFDDTEVEALMAERLRTLGLLVGAQVIFGVFVLTAVLSVRLLRPIDRLKRQAGALTVRDAAPSLEWTRGDELGQLGQHLNEVRARLQGLFGELETKNAALHEMAMHDPLTRLPNRTYLREVFGRHASAAQRAGQRLAMLFVDLDRFKIVNDTLGHAAGDELLQHVADSLRACVREMDIVSRMGGDEFLVLLPALQTGDDVADVVGRILRRLAEPVVLARAGASAQVSASVGVSVFPDDGSDFDALVRTADIAMYRSKETGRGRFSFYHPDLDLAVRGRLALERELERASAQHEWRLHYQPVVDARTGATVGCEALLRWQHPERGLLGPADFIEVAEETGLIRDIGLWTLEAACAQFAAWRAEGCAPRRFAVNVSALQAHDERLPASLHAAMQRHHVARGEIELELTESALLSDTDSALRTIDRLREAGALLSVDDFGTGYSSLSYLKLLKPDKLKVDRSFVRDLPDDADDRALTQAIIGMGRALGITVVAEGVESEAQRTLLQSWGCTLQQGYLYGKPMAAEAFAARMRAEREAARVVSA